jgi:predicted PurR-regulated permease PerM
MDGKQPETKQQNNGLVTRRTVIIFALCIGAILLITQIDAVKSTLSWLGNTLSPILTGVVLAYVINPLCMFFEKRFKRLFARSKKMSAKAKHRVSRGLSILLSILFLIAVIALLLFLIIPEFLESFNKLIGIAPSLVEKGSDWLSDLLESDNTFGQNLIEAIQGLEKTLTDWFGGTLSSVISGLILGATEVAFFIVDLLVSFVVCVYALLEKNRFLGQIKKIIFAVFSPKRANDILDVARHGNSVFGKFIIGKLISSSIVGTITFLFMTAVGMPYALLSAGVIAVTNIIPFFGPFIGGIPTAFIILLTDAQYGIIYVVFLVVLQQLEGNIIEPMIMEDRTGVSKFWITSAVLFFGGVFGIVGMIFSVPIIAVLFYIIRLAVERSLARKGMPVNSMTYRTAGSVDPESMEILPIPEQPPHKKLRQTIREWRNRITKKDENDSSECTNGDNNEEN